jgi:phosphatidylserine decarboxylase
MNGSALIDRLSRNESLNFILTNRIPRQLATRFMGWFSPIEHPLVRDFSIGILKLFAGDLNLHEARTTRFRSLHDCFTRELKPGARPIDESPGVLVSPCDAIVGACGRIAGAQLFQAKGFTYTLEDLLLDPRLAARCRDGCYATLRITPAMYHRFHAPCDCDIDEVTYVSGDTWNVNPIALKRVDRLFCKNERAVVPLQLHESDESAVLVPVASILVASIHFEFLAAPLDLTCRGPNRLRCHASCRKGDELGHFRHGSTIVVLGTRGLTTCRTVREGASIRMGEPLFRCS